MASSAALFGVTEVFAKRAVAGLHPVPLNFIRNTLIALFSLLVLIWRGNPLFEFKGSWWYLLALCLMGPIGSRLFFLSALSHIEVSKAVLINQLQPIHVAILSFAMLGMIPGLREWIGGILILSGCIVMIGARRRVVKINE
jgi:drug/metabolite transporter (DMT)-like permease